MKPVCTLLAVIFTMSCFGGESSAYAMLTNKLSQCIANGSWRYETNGMVRTRKILLSVNIDKQFSDEIIASLRKSCPKEWNEAVSSSGNPANPKMLPLRQYFDNAVLHTPTIIRFHSFAKKEIGHDVALRVHHEKLSYFAINLDKPDKQKRIIRCFLYVEVRSSVNPQNAIENNREKGILLSTLQQILSEEKDNVAVDSCVVLFNARVFLLDASLQNEIQTSIAMVHPVYSYAARYAPTYEGI